MGNGFLQTAVQSVVFGLLVVAILCGVTYFADHVDPDPAESTVAQQTPVDAGQQDTNSPTDAGTQQQTAQSNNDSRDAGQRPSDVTDQDSPPQEFRPLRNLMGRSPLLSANAEERPDFAEQDRRLKNLEASIQRMQRIEDRLDKLLFTLAQSHASPSPSSLDQTSASIGEALRRELSELRINNEVELRDLARQLTGVSSSQKKLAHDWKQYQQDLRASLEKQRLQRIAEQQAKLKQEPPRYEYVEIQGARDEGDPDGLPKPIQPRVIELRQVSPVPDADRKLENSIQPSPRPKLDSVPPDTSRTFPAAKDDVTQTGALIPGPFKDEKSRFRILSTLLHVTLSEPTAVRPAGIQQPTGDGRIASAAAAQLTASNSLRLLHEHHVNRLIASFSDASTVERLATGNQVVDDGSAATIPLGSLCLHCNEINGLNAGDSLHLTPSRAGGDHFVIKVVSRSAPGRDEPQQVASMPNSDVDMAGRQTFIVSETGQDGTLYDPASESPSENPKPAGSRRRIVQRLVVVTVEAIDAAGSANIRHAGFEESVKEPAGVSSQLEALQNLKPGNAQGPRARLNTARSDSSIRRTDQANAVREMPMIENQLKRRPSALAP